MDTGRRNMHPSEERSEPPCKELLPTETEASREVKRLTALNWGTGCLYFAQIGRLFADGPGVSAE